MQPDFYANQKGKTALVTGAGLGIGAALSLALGKYDVNVVCASRTQADIDKVARTIIEEGGQALAVPTDLTSVDQTMALATAIDDTFHGLDIAFLNAGGNWQRESIVDSDVQEWKAAIDLNFVSVFYGIKAVVPLMRKKSGGRIIITGSAMAHYAAKKKSSYCAAKAGARMLVQTAAKELMADNITVNEFIPGPTRTLQALQGITEDNKDSPFHNFTEWVKDPEEVVNMMLVMAAYPGMGPTSQIFSLARR